MSTASQEPLNTSSIFVRKLNPVDREIRHLEFCSSREGDLLFNLIPLAWNTNQSVLPCHTRSGYPASVYLFIHLYMSAATGYMLYHRRQ